MYPTQRFYFKTLSRHVVSVGWITRLDNYRTEGKVTIFNSQLRV